MTGQILYTKYSQSHIISHDGCGRVVTQMVDILTRWNSYDTIGSQVAGYIGLDYIYK